MTNIVKYTIVAILLFCTNLSFAQQRPTVTFGNAGVNGLARTIGRLTADSGYVFTHADSLAIAAMSGGGGGTFPGGTINFASPGTVIPSGNLSTALSAICCQTLPPTSSLSGTNSGYYEERSTGNISTVLSWGACRQSTTAPLSTIVVGGINQTFSQPSQGSCVSGTQSTTVPYQTAGNSTILNNVVTTTDGKSTTSSVGYYAAASRYWGKSLTNTASSITYTSGSNELTTSFSRAKSAFSIPISGGSAYYVYYAYPSIYGNLTSLTIGGFESLPAFNLTVITVIEAGGYSRNYNVYISQNSFPNDVNNIVAN